MIDQPSFTQEELEKLNPVIKKMREQNEKMKSRNNTVPHDPQKLAQAQQDIKKAYDLLVVPDDALKETHPGISSRYFDSLGKIKQERDDLLKAKTCREAVIPLMQFKGKSKMTLGFLKTLEADIDETLFGKLTNHSFSRPAYDKKENQA